MVDFLQVSCDSVNLKKLPVNIHIGYFSVVTPSLGCLTLTFFDRGSLWPSLKISEALSRIKLLNRTANLTEPDAKGEEENEAQNAQKVQNVWMWRIMVSIAWQRRSLQPSLLLLIWLTLGQKFLWVWKEPNMKITNCKQFLWQSLICSCFFVFNFNTLKTPTLSVHSLLFWCFSVP